MALLYKRGNEGGFTVGDTVTGRTCYAYPTSCHAEDAIKAPERVAREMMDKENALGRFGPPELLAEFARRDEDNMTYLHAV